jgi:sugar phosphate isomerase/epimerase
MVSKKSLGFSAYLDFVKWSPEIVVEEIARAGYSAVAYTLAHFNPRTKSPAALRNLIDVTEKGGLIVSEIVVQQDFLTKDSVLRKDRSKLVEECILAAADVGIKNLNVFSGPATWDPEASRIPEDITQGNAWDLLVSTYEPLVKLAEKNQVCLALEPAFNMLCHDYYSTQEFFRRIDSPWLGINLDPSHLTLYRNDVPWVIRQWSRKIRHVHLKDVIGRPGTPGQDFIFPLLGEGLVHWRDFFAALDEIDYRGYMSVEFESFEYYSRVLRNDPVKAARLCMSQLEELMTRKDKDSEAACDHSRVRGPSGD